MASKILEDGIDPETAGEQGAHVMLTEDRILLVRGHMLTVSLAPLHALPSIILPTTPTNVCRSATDDFTIFQMHNIQRSWQ
jgi:hypothetical protein